VPITKYDKALLVHDVSAEHPSSSSGTLTLRCMDLLVLTVLIGAKQIVARFSPQ